MVNPNPNNPVGLVPQLHGAGMVNLNPNNPVELGPQLHGVVTVNPNPVIHTAVIHKCRHLVELVLRLHGVATKLVEVQDIIQMATTANTIHQNLTITNLNMKMRMKTQRLRINQRLELLLLRVVIVAK